MNTFKQLQLFYIISLLVTLTFTGLCEGGILPENYIGNDVKTIYWINLYAIISGLGGMFVALRWFNFRTLRKQVNVEDTATALDAFARLTRWRLFLLGFVLLTNTILHYATAYTENPKFCLLITLIAYAFCWPSTSGFKSLREIH